MARTFSLCIEFGNDKAAAVRGAEKLAPKLQAVHRRVFEDLDGFTWAMLDLDIDPNDEDAVARASEHCTRVLADTDLPFRFGQAGGEPDEARSWPELLDDIEAGTVLPGLVLSRATYEELGRPQGFEPLGKGYVAS